MARPKKKEIHDPSKPLPHIKHEVFANMLVANKGNQTEAYLDTYGAQKKENASANASRLLTSNDTVRQRVLYLLDQNELSLETTVKALRTQLRAKKAIVIDNSIEYVNDNSSIDRAIDTSLKLHGALEDKPLVANNILNNTVLFNPDRLERALDRLEALEAKRLRPRPSGIVE